MLHTGSTGGRAEPGPPSPGGDLQEVPAVEESLHRKLQKRLLLPETTLYQLPPAESKPDPKEDGLGDGGEEKGEENEEGSSHVVEHILKELKGINKIQEEISDLRQYLTSVRGSVDQVSYCLDTVLSEIGDLYLGASAAPLPAAVYQTRNIRRRSLGRQNAVTSPPSANGRPICVVDRPTDQQPDEYKQDEYKLDAGAANIALCYMELHRRHDYQSTSSLSSCLSLEAAFASEESHPCQVGGCSEEDACSSLQSGLALWDRLSLQETERSTPAHSSHNSSEHLSLLFGCQYNSPSSGRLKRTTESKGDKLACRCPVDCPYWSSGSHAVDPCLNEHGSGPSRSLSSSKVQLMDCDDGYLEPSSGDTLDLGSSESLYRDEAGDALSGKSSLMDLESPSTSFHVRTFSTAVLKFRSTLKVALKKLEGFKPEEDVEEEAVQYSDLEEEFRQTGNNTPVEDCKALVLTENMSCSSQTSRSNSPHSTTQSHFVELSGERTGFCAPLSVSKKAVPKCCTEGHAASHLGPELRPDEAQLSPIRENQGLAEVSQACSTSISHKERIANFQRILREKRRASHRLSRSVLGSQSSQGSQSQDEAVPGTFRVFMGPNPFTPNEAEKFL